VQKKSIAVYNPEAPLERAIQSSSHDINGEWLSSYQCQLMARAISSLKIFDQWRSDENLLRLRLSYFFEPHMIRHKETLVFLTHLLYVRDILDNKEINSYIHSPIVFMSVPLSYYLFREYPLHIHVDFSTLSKHNTKVDFIDIGGLVIVDQNNVCVNYDAITDIINMCDKSSKYKVTDDRFESIINKAGLMGKVAASPISRGIFRIDEDQREIYPDMAVLHKEEKLTGNVFLIEPGENGRVGIRYADGSEEFVPQESFDNEFVILDTKLKGLNK
jgi:hypothetical protein